MFFCHGKMFGVGAVKASKNDTEFLWFWSLAPSVDDNILPKYNEQWLLIPPQVYSKKCTKP